MSRECVVERVPYTSGWWCSTHKSDAEDCQEPDRRVVPCTTKTPEPHERGEFPMTCYACHVWADS